MSFELRISGRTVEELNANLRALAVASSGAAEIARQYATSGATLGTIVAGAITSTEEDDDGTVNTAAPNVDSKGTPWLDGIHSSSKKLNGDGTWRRARGVDKAHAEAAENAARAGAPSPVVATQPAPMPMPTIPQPQPQPQPQPAPMPTIPQPMPQPAPMPTIPQPMPQPQPVAPAPADTMDVTTFWTNVVNPILSSDPQGQMYFASLAQRLGIAAFTDIISNGALVPHAIALMRQDGRIS